MPSIALTAPVAIVLATAGAVALCGVAGWKIDRFVLAGGAWVAILALIALWAPVRSTQELNAGQLGFGPFDLRLDAVAFLFALAIMVPSAVLLTMQQRSWQGGEGAGLWVAGPRPAVGAGGVAATTPSRGAGPPPAP